VGSSLRDEMDGTTRNVSAESCQAADQNLFKLQFEELCQKCAVTEEFYVAYIEISPKYNCLMPDSTNFPKLHKLLQNSGCQKGDIM